MSERAAPSARSAHLRRRHLKERLFRLAAASAVATALGALLALLGAIAWQGIPSFWQHTVTLDLKLDEALIDPRGGRDPADLATAYYVPIVKNALYDLFPDVTQRRERRDLGALVSIGAASAIRDRVVAEPSLVGKTITMELPLDDQVDVHLKHEFDGQSPLSAHEQEWLAQLVAAGRVHDRFALDFFRVGDSREPELAGIRGALVGSAWTLLVTLLFSLPVGVAAAIYLEEFARPGRVTDWIEVNVNNLAAVPSIVFGLLGLALLLGVLGLPRSTPLVGGIVLSWMTLPTIVVAARASIRAVPASIRQAALAIGASPLQTLAHHVLPLALPGILTGTILGMARALGETAPLLMIGMVAFIADVPKGPLSPATVLPVQIFLWSDSPERAFVARTSGAILVLLGFLVAMNLSAVWLRSRFEKRW